MTESARRGFWTQDDHGRDVLVAITYSDIEAESVWDSMRRARAIVIERVNEEHRYKGRLLRGWSEEDGFFYAESPDEDPGSKHRVASGNPG